MPCLMARALGTWSLEELTFPGTRLSATWPGTDTSSSALPVSQQVVWRCRL